MLITLFSLTWIEVLGTTYKPGGIVVISVETVPTFGLISDVIVLDTTDYFLVVKKMHTVCFNAHLHGYEVDHCELQPEYFFLKQSHLADHNMLGFYKNSYVILKYTVL